jgi:Spy/CpxP family protein refolding chaperone
MIAYKKIKKTIISLALLVIASSFTYADSSFDRHDMKKMTPEQRVDRQIEGMKKRLNITNEQATQIATVLQQEQKTLMADRQKMMDAPPELKAAARIQLQQDRLNLKQKVLSNLTVDQRIKAEDLRKEHQKKMMKRMHRHHKFQHHRDRW